MAFIRKQPKVLQPPDTISIAFDLYSKIQKIVSVPDSMLIVGGVGLSMFTDIGRSIPDIDIVLRDLSTQQLKSLKKIDGLRINMSPSDNYFNTHSVYKGTYKSVDVDLISNGLVIHGIHLDYMFEHSDVRRLGGVDIRVLDKSLLMVIKFLAGTDDLKVLNGLDRSDKDFADIRAMLRAYYSNDPDRFIRDEREVIEGALGRGVASKFFAEFHRVIPGFQKAKLSIAAAKPALERLKRGPAGRPDPSALSQSL